MLVVQVPVNRHPLPLLPALDRGHVAVEVCRDLLPRIQPVFGRSLGWRCAKGWVAHRALLLVRSHDSLRGTELYVRQPSKGTAKDGIRRQVGECCNSAPYRLNATLPGAPIVPLRHKSSQLGVFMKSKQSATVRNHLVLTLAASTGALAQDWTHRGNIQRGDQCLSPQTTKTWFNRTHCDRSRMRFAALGH